MAQVMKKEKVVKIAMSLVMLGMVGVMVWMWVTSFKTWSEAAKVSDNVYEHQNTNFRYYVNEYKVTKDELDVTTVQLNQVTQELESTNLELASTRGELTAVQQLNDQLKTSIQSLERYKEAAMAKGEALENMITSFKQKNKDLDHQLQMVRKELAVYQPDITDIKEGRSKILLFKDHIRMVKKNMKVIKVHAEEVRVAAQQERDRLEMMYGNNGYMVKNGQNKSVTSFDQKRVEIDVKFVNP